VSNENIEIFNRIINHVRINGVKNVCNSSIIYAFCYYCIIFDKQKELADLLYSKKISMNDFKDAIIYYSLNNENTIDFKAYNLLKEDLLNVLKTQENSFLTTLYDEDTKFSTKFDIPEHFDNLSLKDEVPISQWIKLTRKYNRSDNDGEKQELLKKIKSSKYYPIHKFLV